MLAIHDGHRLPRRAFLTIGGLVPGAPREIAQTMIDWESIPGCARDVGSDAAFRQATKSCLGCD